jgi:hypothetical protein
MIEQRNCLSRGWSAFTFTFKSSTADMPAPDCNLAKAVVPSAATAIKAAKLQRNGYITSSMQQCSRSMLVQPAMHLSRTGGASNTRSLRYQSGRMPTSVLLPYMRSCKAVNVACRVPRHIAPLIGHCLVSLRVRLLLSCLSKYSVDG